EGQRVSLNVSCYDLALELQQATDYPGDPLPFCSLARELFTAAFRDRIVFRLAVVFRRPPLRSDPFPLLELQKRRIDGSLIQLQNLLAHLLNSASDPIPMLWPERVENFQRH